MYDEIVKRLRELHPEAFGDALDFAFACQQAMHEAADAIENLSKPRWIPVGERLPETGVDVLVKFPQNMAVASIDIGEWVVNSGDGWCTDINLAGGEKNPTHWMPLPQGPEEET